MGWNPVGPGLSGHAQCAGVQVLGTPASGLGGRCRRSPWRNALQRIEYNRARQGSLDRLMEWLWCSWRGHRWGFACQQTEFTRIAQTGPDGWVLRPMEVPAVEWITHRCPRCELIRAVGLVLADGSGDGAAAPRERREGVPGGTLLLFGTRRAAKRSSRGSRSRRAPGRST